MPDLRLICIAIGVEEHHQTELRNFEEDQKHHHPGEFGHTGIGPVSGRQREGIPGPASATGRMVAEIASALAASHDQDEISDTIVRRLAELGAIACHLLLVDPVTKELTLAAEYGVPPHLADQLAVVSSDAPLLSACAARTRELQVIYDLDEVGQSLVLARQLLEATGSRSMVSVPLLALGELVGVLTWTEGRPVVLTEEARATLGAISDVLALGIENARNVAALRQSNDRFEEIIAAAPIGMSIVSLDGRFVRPNRALCESLGYSAAELTKLRFQDITYPEDLEKDLHLVGQLARGEIPRYQLPKRYIRKDGQVIEIILHGSVVRDGGEPLYYIAQIEDVTESNRQQEALARSEASFRLLAQNARDMIFRYRLEPEARFEYVSPSSTSISGYTPEEYYADPELATKIIHADDRAWLDGSRHDPESAGEPKVVRLVHKEGHTIWIEQRTTPVYDDGNIVAIEGISRDVTQRKMSEAALAESEERLRFIVQHSPDAMFIQDRSLRYLWVADPGDSLVAEYLIGKTDFDYLPATQAAHLAWLKRIVLETGEGQRSIVSASPGGREQYFDLVLEPRRDAAGDVIGIAGYARDITEEKHVEGSLRDSEARLKLWQRVSGIGSWDWDLTSGRLTWSPEVFRILCVDPDVFDRTFEAFMARVHPEDREEVHNRLQEALSGGARFDLDYRFIRDDGEAVVVHVEADVLGDPGYPRQVVGFVQNITERHQLERERECLVNELAVEKHWLDEVIDSSPIGMMLFEETGRTRANRVAEDIFGADEYGDEVPPGSPKVYYLDGRPVPPEERVSLRVLRGERIEGLELLVKRSDGSECRVLGSAVPLVDGQGRITGGVAVFADVTRLRNLERMREEWAGVIAHDLRQPLTLMLSRVEMLSARCLDKGDFHAEFSHLQGSIERMNRMVGELLDASLLESKRVILHQTREDLIEILARTVDGVVPLGNQILLNVPPEALYAYVDAHRIEQIMLNLLTNAAKYGRSDRPIRVTLAPLGNEALISVQNEGDPIPAHELPTLFERFWRSSSVGAKAGGLGLGLYIVHGLVTAHGGHIWAESTPSGVTTFYFTLPVAAQSH